MSAPLLLVLSLLASSEVPPRHQLSLYVHAGGALYLSGARTQGGLGGGFGVRDTLDGRWLLQADASGLTGLGSVLALRLGAGVQRRGTWTPSARVELTGFFGDRLSFLTPQHPTPLAGPAVALSGVLAPARFTLGGTHLSLLELSMGAGTDAPGLGRLYGITLLEVGVAL